MNTIRQYIIDGNFPLCVDEIEKNISSINEYIDDKGNNLSHIAAYHNTKSDIMQLLVKKGININHQNKDGVVPLGYSVIMGRKEISYYLLSLPTCNLNLEDDCGGTVCHHCIRYERYDILSHILKTFDDVNLESIHYKEGSLLEYSLNIGRIDIFKALINKGANIHIRCRNGEPLIFKLLNDPSSLKYLIDRKYNINICNRKGDSPLHVAVTEGRLDVIDILLRHRANINYRGANLNSPLHLAVIKGDLAIISLLLKHRARKDMINQQGAYPKDMTNDSQIIKLLNF